MTTHRSYGREGVRANRGNELNQEYWTEWWEVMFTTDKDITE